MSNVNNSEYWEDLLESEGLGVLDLDVEARNVNGNIKHIKGKWRRLDAMLNGIAPDTAAIMSNSPKTARAVDTRVTFADDVQPDLDDGLHDLDDLGDSVWESLMLAFIATPKEAEIADRARRYVLGLDPEHKPNQPKIRRLSKHMRAANIRARQRGEAEPYPRNPYMDELAVTDSNTEYAVPRCEFYKREQGLPCATHDAGNGPLSIKDVPAPEPIANDQPEQLRMSPVVDTLGYLPGRSPFQMSRTSRHNSDITG